ncbi:MAG: hypothetical protein MMC33_009172 [Icmadophila ericetorum]|nr:hypothetical protein [Icmadophila ericetorum]
MSRELELSGFPTLKPAIITKVHIGDVHDLGTIHNGSRLTHYVSAEPPKSSTRQPPSNLGQEEYFADLFFQGTPTGSIESVPGFEPAFKANVNFGADWLSFDPDGKHARIDLRGVARTEQGHAIDFRYVGVIKMPPEVWKIFNMDSDMATVPFGYATGSHTFLVADPALKDLENSVFVSNGRIIVHEKGLTVETRQSLVVASTAMD